jgi:hypothetical protein
MGTETRRKLAKLYHEASEKFKGLDPVKNWEVYYKEFEDEFKVVVKKKAKKESK